MKTPNPDRNPKPAAPAAPPVQMMLRIEPERKTQAGSHPSPPPQPQRKTGQIVRDTLRD